MLYIWRFYVSGRTNIYILCTCCLGILYLWGLLFIYVTKESDFKYSNKFSFLQWKMEKSKADIVRPVRRWSWFDGPRALASPWSTETWTPCSSRLLLGRSSPSASCRSFPLPLRASEWASSSGCGHENGVTPDSGFTWCHVQHLFSFHLCLQEESTGEITFYMKGADVAMASIVQYNDWLEEEVKTLSLIRNYKPLPYFLVDGAAL